MPVAVVADVRIAISPRHGLARLSGTAHTYLRLPPLPMGTTNTAYGNIS